MTDTPLPMPDEIWVSEYDSCLFFENEDDANTIAGKGVNIKYIRADLCRVTAPCAPQEPEIEVRGLKGAIQATQYALFEGDPWSTMRQADLETLLEASKRELARYGRV